MVIHSPQYVPYCASLAYYRGGAADIRHCNRALIGRGVLLTVPVEGGSRSLKRLEHACGGRAEAQADLRSPRISLHGDWPRVHLGALEAVYGRAPFFAHYFPAVSGIIAGPPESLFGLNAAIDAERLLAQSDPALSMLDALFRLGPEAIFLLVEAF